MCPLSLQPYQSTDAQDRSPRSAAIRGHILFAIAMILLLALLWRLRSVLELVYVSALFAVVLMPFVQHIMRVRIRRWSPSRPVAIIALVLSVFIVLSLFLIFALPPAFHDARHFAADLPGRVSLLLSKLRRLPIADKLGAQGLAQRSEGILSSAARFIVDSAPLWLHGIFDILTAFVLCVYFMLEGEFAYYYLLSFFATNSRERLAGTLAAAQVRISDWLLGQGALMLILGVCSTIAFAALRVHYFFLLGVLMGLFNIIPVVGGVFTILLVGAVAATDSWTKMAGVFIFYAVYVNVENSYLIPRVMRRSVNLPGLAVLIALLAGTELAGVVGALVAVPTAALIAVLMDEYLVHKDGDVASTQALTENALEAAVAAKAEAEAAQTAQTASDATAAASAAAHAADAMHDAGSDDADQAEHTPTTTTATVQITHHDPPS